MARIRRTTRGRVRPRGPLPVRRDAPGRGRPVGPLGHRPGARPPPGHRPPRRPTGARACRRSEPLLAPGIHGGADLPEDHQVDNRLVAAALVAACRSSGVTFVADEVARIVVRGGRAVGVELSGGGHRDAGVVVVAAGSRSGDVGGLPEDVRPPVRPVRGMTVRLSAGAGVPRLRRTVRALVHGRSCYLVPRDDGGLVVGATMEERGSDLSVPLGGLVDLLDDARRVVPALDEYSVLETSCGLRPGSPDNGPIVGTDEGRRTRPRHRALPQRHPAGPPHRRRGGEGAGRRGRRRRTPRTVRRLPSGSVRAVRHHGR